VAKRILGLLHRPREQRGTEAINGVIELHRRVARGFRNHERWRLRMLLVRGELTHPHLK
jgi:hypothetical protein